MFFLPLQGKTRFAALPDTPEMEESLKAFFVGDTSWDSFLASHESDLVPGEPFLGVAFKKGETFVSTDMGFPQVFFEAAPRTLLFVFGFYSVSTSSSSVSYGRVLPAYFRWHIDPEFYFPDEQNVSDLWQRVYDLDTEKASRTDLSDLSFDLDHLRGKMGRLAKRQDPLSTVLPALSSEAATRERVLRDLQSQINQLQPEIVPGSIDLTNYYTKDQVEEILLAFVTSGYLDAALNGLLQRVEFESHVYETNPHGVRYSDVGSPSTSEHQSVLASVNSLLDRLGVIESKGYLTGLTSEGGLLITPSGDGTMHLDPTFLPFGEENPPSEIEFFRSSVLSVETGASRWYAWQRVHVFNIRASVNTPPQGGSVVLDVRRNGVSLYGSSPELRPTILDGQNTTITSLPGEVILEEGDYLSVDIAEVGETNQGADLSIQLRYEYV